MKRHLPLVVFLACAALFATACEKLKARDQLNKGVQSYKSAQFPAAVDHFKQAVELDPSFPTARLYLATAYMSQYIPGADSPENMQMAKAAFDQFTEVLRQDPKNELATASIASLYFNQKKTPEAKEWYTKLITLNPKNKEAHYTMGVIAWTEWYKPYMEAKAKLGMKPEDPGPIKDKKVKPELREKWGPVIDDGIKHLEQALSIDDQYDDAMAYMNLLIRERADLSESPDEYKKQIEVANNWVDKALAAKKVKEEKKSKSSGGITTEETK